MIRGRDKQLIAMGRNMRRSRLLDGEGKRACRCTRCPMAPSSMVTDDGDKIKRGQRSRGMGSVSPCPDHHGTRPASHRVSMDVVEGRLHGQRRSPTRSRASPPARGHRLAGSSPRGADLKPAIVTLQVTRTEQGCEAVAQWPARLDTSCLWTRSCRSRIGSNAVQGGRRDRAHADGKRPRTGTSPAVCRGWRSCSKRGKSKGPRDHQRKSTASVEFGTRLQDPSVGSIIVVPDDERRRRSRWST